MSKRRNKYSTIIVKRHNKIIGYLSKRDEDNGLDIQLDRLDYKLEAI